VPRYRLTIAYEGTAFCGWQKQEPPAEPPTRPDAPIDAGAEPTRRVPAYSPSTPLLEPSPPGRVALRTVQGVLERAVRLAVRQEVEVLGASRTDAGVHARGQVAAFSCAPDESGTPPPGVGWPLARGTEALVAAINSRLPDDVLVLDAVAVPASFDPVGGALHKTYSYTWAVSRRRPLWDRRTVAHVWRDPGLDIDAMNAAAGVLVGEHDFAAFAAAGHGRTSTVRRVLAAEVAPLPAPGPREQRLRLTITGTGFLWNMVRIIAGTLIEVGTGRRTPAQVADALASRDRARAGPTAPPEGLCLERITYPGDA
jgi:tRNA pseudouridine38-40 synthase